MKIHENWNSTYPDALNHYWKFSNLSVDDKKSALFFGWAIMENLDSYLSSIEKYENRFYFNNEHPCVLQSTDERLISLSMDSNRVFSNVYNQCPYTANWINSLENSDRFRYIFTPFNKNYIIDKIEGKTNDVLYWGGLHGTDHKDILDTIKDFDYNFLTLGPSSWNLWWGRESSLPPISNYTALITYQNLQRPFMWQLLRRTKVNVMTNLLYTDDKINNNIRTHQHWEKNEAFAHLDQYIMPQLKTRPIETAINRCLMVVKKDPWNIQELFFEPNKEFIYYNDKKELQHILEDVKINWKHYEPIVENAFNKAINNYTTEHFIEKIKQECV